VTESLGNDVTDVEVTVWSAELSRLHARIAGRFARSEPRRRAGQYLFGLAAGLGRKNGWTLAEQAGDLTPDGMQRLLRWADWDVDRVRDDVRDYLIEHLGEPDGVLIIGEVCFPKKGIRSAGVTRQRTGIADQIENCQIGIFLAYQSSGGLALADRELYLPAAWTDDRDRCRAAGIPDEIGFATKSEMAREMLAQAFTAGVPTAWVAMDEVYWQSRPLRVWLEEIDQPYVVATLRSDDVLTTGTGRTRADELIGALRARAWSRVLARPADFRWARVPIGADRRAGRGHWLLARRTIATGELAYYLCYGPRRTTLTVLARVADGCRAVEECFQQARRQAGLDQYQVRDWRPWYAHITLAMATYAGLVVAGIRAGKGKTASGGDLT
jgi:SRSO17 transposase